MDNFGPVILIEVVLIFSANNAMQRMTQLLST
jgi:hypothetical protein